MSRAEVLAAALAEHRWQSCEMCLCQSNATTDETMTYWEHQAHLAVILDAALAAQEGERGGVDGYLNNAGITTDALRYAATHEGLCRSWIFDLLTGLADTIEAQP